tara:strand:- start:5371 stop:5646 length:276 start_codon:yes stop_codon:yes gene_type:complete
MSICLLAIDFRPPNGDDGLRRDEEHGMELISEITCPRCGHREREEMPVDACQWFYDCKGCGALLKPEAGDCCVFCSYGTVPCPPVQQGKCC